MKFRELIRQWEANAASPNTDHELKIRLPIYDAAKIAALAELFPGRSEEQIITELLAAALDEVGAAFSYQQGEKVVSHDDQGDPIYEDIGLTPSFHKLTEAHARRLLNAKDAN